MMRGHGCRYSVRGGAKDERERGCGGRKIWDVSEWIAFRGRTVGSADRMSFRFLFGAGLLPCLEANQVPILWH